MNVCLLYPAISGIGFNTYGKGMEESWISHGLCSISAYAKKSGYRIGMIDLRRLKGWDELKEILEREQIDVIGITMMSVDYNPAMEAIRVIKKVSPETRIVVGGPHPTILTAEMEKERDIDYIVVGEGEKSFTDLLGKIERGEESPRIIRGVSTENLDTLPFADRELFHGLEYPLPVKEFDRPFVTVIAGRGCRFNCNYCQPAERHIFGKKVRRRSPLNVIQELEVLREKYAFNSMMIHDDCITEDRSWVMEFVRLYKERGFNKPFACQSRADIICRHEDMVELMAGAGLKLFFIGFESGNQRVLNFIRKGTKVEHNYKSAEICRKYGIGIWANYMMGLPTETEEEIMDTVRMIQAIKPDHYSPAFFTPHPGSDLYQYVIDKGLFNITSHDQYRRNATGEVKIKGVDYDFLNRAMLMSMGGMPFMQRLKAAAMPFLGRHRRLRNAVKKIVELTTRTP